MEYKQDIDQSNNKYNQRILELKVSQNNISAQPLRLLARFNQNYKKYLNMRNFESVSLEFNNKKIGALVQFSAHIADGYIDLTQDVIDFLKCTSTDIVIIKRINTLPQATQVTISYSKAQAQKYGIKDINRIDLIPILLCNPLNKGLEFKIDKLKYKIIQIGPPGFEFVSGDRTTNIKLLQEQIASSYVTYEKIGGLKQELNRIKELIDLPITNPKLFERMNIQPPRGILLYGPPGTGKTLLARAIANVTQSNFYPINGPDIVSKFYGDSQKKLRMLFQKAKQNAPAIIFIDEIDSIAPRRDKVFGQVQKRIVAQLLALMDGLESRGRIVIIGATNLPNSLDDALRRGGRFDVEIEIKPPNPEARLDILKIILEKTPLSKEIDLYKIAKDKTNGFVGADLNVLCKEASLNAIKRFVKSNRKDPENLEVQTIDLDTALKRVEPSSLREFNIQVPNVKWQDISGINNIVSKIRDELQIPIKSSEVYKKYNFQSIRGILLYGPPGTGKTLITKAIASELNYNFIAIRGPELLSKYLGQTEQTIRSIFRKARNSAPTVIFMDEIDAICTSRTSQNLQSSSYNINIIGQILTEMDGISDMKNVIVIATTNRPDLIDRALIRPGRFDKLIEIPRPDKSGLKEIYELYLKKLPTQDNIDLQDISDISFMNKLTGADVYAVCRDSLALAIKQIKDISDLDQSDINVKITQKILRICLDNIIINSKSSLKNQLTSYDYGQTNI
jgi:transitional endoplasmic reticulum ATPase